MIIRHHWFIFVRTVFTFFKLTLAPLLIVIPIVFFVPLSDSAYEFTVYILGAGYTVWFAILWAAFGVAWADFYLDSWTVGETAMQHIEQNGFFDRRVTTWQLDSVLDVTVHTQGIIASTLKFGTITIETAGASGDNESFDGTPNPEEVRAYILSRVRDVQKLSEKTREQELEIKSISHDAKGHLTMNQAVLAGIAEGDFGAVSEEVKKAAERALYDTKTGVSSLASTLTHTATPTVFNLGDAISAEVDALRPLMAEKNIALSTSLAPLSVKGNRDVLVRDVIRNLLNNALIYTPAGSIHVELTSVGSDAKLTVSDTGVGISIVDMERLFTANGHGKYSSTINPESTGNGLYLARVAIEAHHGKIWAESDGPGKGSRFFVTLPIHAAA